MTPVGNKSEKRRYPRLPVSMKIEGRWWDIEGEEHKLAAWMTAVSEGGALLRCADSILVNSTLEFVLRLGTMKTIEVQAVIRWWRRNGQVRDIGVEFVEPIRLLGVYVEKQMAMLDPPPSPTSSAQNRKR